MKNHIVIFLFILIIPFSIGDTENKGCYSSDKEKKEIKNKDENNSDLKKNDQDKKTSSGSQNRFYCYPYSVIE